MKKYSKIENIINHSEVSEKEIEKYLIRRTKEIGLICLKYSNPNMIGYPDRMILLPNSKIIWVELKSKGKKPSSIQLVRFSEMKKLGHIVQVVDSKKGIDMLIDSFIWKGLVK